MVGLLVGRRLAGGEDVTVLKYLLLLLCGEDMIGEEVKEEERREAGDLLTSAGETEDCGEEVRRGSCGWER